MKKVEERELINRKGQLQLEFISNAVSASIGKEVDNLAIVSTELEDTKRARKRALRIAP